MNPAFPEAAFSGRVNFFRSRTIKKGQRIWSACGMPRILALFDHGNQARIVVDQAGHHGAIRDVCDVSGRRGMTGIDEMGTDQRTTERRWVNRSPKKLAAIIRRSGSPKRACMLADLSPDGCGMTDVLNLRVGERVWVGLPGLEGQPAEVRWTATGSAGLQFDRPLYPAVVERILQA